MVSASHNPADDNGLKVLDAPGLKLDDAIEDELEQLIWRAEELAGSANAEIGRVVDARGAPRSLPRPSAGAGRSRSTARGLRIVLDCANGSGGDRSARDPGGDRRDGRGHPRRARRREHQRPLRRHRAGVARARGRRPRRRRRVRARRRRRPAHRGRRRRAGSSTATRCSASWRSTGWSAACCPAAALVVSVLSNGGLQAAVEAAGGAVVRTPVGDKYILEGMQVIRAALGGEKSGHVIVLEHTTSGDGIVTALEVLRVMTPRGEPLADSPRPSRCCPQQQRAVKARHKDQWEGDPALRGRSPTRATGSATAAGSSSGRPARSPRSGSWSRGRTPTSSRSWPTRSRPSRVSD